MADADSDDEGQEVLKASREPKEEAKEEDTSLANDSIVNKYQEAARIAQATLIEVAALCVGMCNISFLYGYHSYST
jgi:hypothetical protein